MIDRYIYGFVDICSLRLVRKMFYRDFGFNNLSASCFLVLTCSIVFVLKHGWTSRSFESVGQFQIL